MWPLDARDEPAMNHHDDPDFGRLGEPAHHQAVPADAQLVLARSPAAARLPVRPAEPTPAGPVPILWRRGREHRYDGAVAVTAERMRRRHHTLGGAQYVAGPRRAAGYLDILEVRVDRGPRPTRNPRRR